MTPLLHHCPPCRYLVDSHWFKQWKKYVGFDSWDKYQMGDQNVYPGPVDNSGLLRGKSDDSSLSQTLKYSVTFTQHLVILEVATKSALLTGAFF